LLLVTRVTTKLNSHFYDFSVIFGAIYKLLHFRSRVEDRFLYIYVLIFYIQAPTGF
jgi:hypothetical protein